VIGGGLAGSAACLAMARQGRAVTWIAPSVDASDMPGESLAAAAAPLLAELGASDLLADPAHRPTRVSFTSWGSAALLERHAAAQPGGLGHVLDRARFDAALFASAHRHPKVRHVEGQLRDFERSDDGWSLATDTGETTRARFLIDATGRRALIARRLSPLRRVDRLVAAYSILRQVDRDIDPTPATLIEAVDTGWWYATLLADRRLVINFYSDPDLMPRGIAGNAAAWQDLLDRTTYIARWIESAGYAASEPPRLATAGTAWLEQAAGPNWLAVGDAAASFDPLSAHGMTTALWTGIQAAEAALRAVDGDDAAPERYGARLEAGREHFRRERTAIYSREPRFSGHKFWQRRQSPGH